MLQFHFNCPLPKKMKLWITNKKNETVARCLLIMDISNV